MENQPDSEGGSKRERLGKVREGVRWQAHSWQNGSQICAYKLAGLKVHKVEFIVG